MAKIAIVNKESLRIETIYDAAQPMQQNYGGPWGNSSESSHLVVPVELEGESIETLQVTTQTEKWTKSGEADILDEANLPLDWQVEGYVHVPPIIVEQNVQGARDSKLRSLRSEVDKLLKEADTERKKHEDNDPNKIATAADWSTYRIALRVATDSYKDVADKDMGTDALDVFALDMSDFVYPTKPS